MRRAAFPLILLILAGLASPAAAAELIMLEQPGCPWCARFNEEIAPAYAKTQEGRRAPLRRVDITQAWPADLDFVERERFTPTFVLVEGGREFGRIRGYPGDEFFWYLVGDLIAKLDETQHE
ncbi:MULTISPECIES: thioredoxin family protein [Nitratireductor]|uniref:thioredoxin family protein n=1 Tax=Nitratireductor TaxID=245876 RepID=UPI000D0CC5D3|nr:MULTISPECIES: thioredoxin family protein [Nitratireductor]PSM18806.1 transcriptional regulator [Nitratireductor sp. StC3]